MKFLFVIVFLFLSVVVHSQDFSIVAVGDASLLNDKFLVQVVYHKQSFTKKQQELIEAYVDLIKNDFSFYKKRFTVEEEIKDEKPSFSVADYDDLMGKNITYFLRIGFHFQNNIPLFQFTLFNSRDKRELLKRTGVVEKSDYRAKLHEITNDFYKEITGKESIFRSKILFVSDKGTSRRKQVKELYIMDFDGHDIKRLTHHGGVVISPAISVDGKKVLYSLIRNTSDKNRNNDLYIMDLESKKAEMLSNKEGINSGAVFLPDGEHIALTLSHTGNTEIYEMNINTKQLRRITSHFADDVDPSVSVDGTLMAFLSDRPGKAMIYTLDPRGKEKDVKRISFVGQFNATPRFSPDGKEIAFSSWLDNRFDIFRINRDGSGLSRLTKNFGSNEDPTYSNEGEFIAFSSQRVISSKKATNNIYVMTREGDIVTQITNGFGNCITPRWSR